MHQIDEETDVYDGPLNGKTYSYEAGLSDMNPFSKFRRESYYLSMKQSGSSSDFENRSAEHSSGMSIDYRVHEHMLAKPIDGVFRYSLNSKRTKGSIGRLMLTNVRLKFVNYNDSSSSNGHPLMPPFDFHSFMDESLGSGTEFDDDIDFLVIHKCEGMKKDHTQHFLLTVLCNDCRRIEFLLVEGDESRSFVDQLTKLLSPPSLTSSLLLSPNSSGSLPYFTIKRIHELPMIWFMLCTQYSYFDLKEWEHRDGYWYKSNPFLRLTQCNEELQVSVSLPKCFVSSILMSDIFLTENVAYQLSGQRVPVISFSIPVLNGKSSASPVSTKRHTIPKAPSGMSITRSASKLSGVKPAVPKKPISLRRMKDHRLLIRSVPLTEDVNNLIRALIFPLRAFDMFHLLKGVLSVEMAHSKLLEAVFNRNTNHFFSLIGKWMKMIHRVFRVVHQVVHVLQNESSVILIEENDRFWNPVISCLVQVVVDPWRRTIQGFESLLSREWMFVNGFANRYPDSMRSPNHVTFVLFIDCVHQLIAFASNGLSFEFTSLYLIRLMDLQYLPSPYSSANNVRDLMSSFEDLTKIGVNGGRRRSISKKSNNFMSNASPEIPMTLDGVSADQVLFLLNPLFDSERTYEDLTRTTTKKETYEKGVQVPQHMASLSMFEGMYLRWHWMGKKNEEYYMRFPMYQVMCWDQLMKQRQAAANSRRGSLTKSSNDSYTETEL